MGTQFYLQQTELLNQLVELNQLQTAFIFSILAFFLFKELIELFLGKK